MDIRIYQIDLSKDDECVSFMSLEQTRKALQSDTVDSSRYELVFDGTVESDDLEEVFEILQGEKPEGYKGRSLSVSDVVEVIRSDSIWPGCYFCDDAGFEEIAFDTDLPKELEKRLIRAVLVKPGKKAEITEIDSSLSGMQKLVGGFVEVVYPWEEETCLLCNEDGKLDGLPLNRALKSKGEVYDIIAGTFFVCGCREDTFSSLSDEQAEHYKSLFENPERFYRINGEIKAIPYEPKKAEKEQCL